MRRRFFLSAVLLLMFGGLVWSDPPPPLGIQTQCVASAAASGTGDAITIPALPCALTTNLLILSVHAGNATTTPTLQPLGLPAQVIIRPNGLPVEVGDLQANYRALLNPNGLNWILLNPANAELGGIGVTDGSTTVSNIDLLTLPSGFTVSGTSPNGIATPNWASDVQIWTGTSHVMIDPAGANGAIGPVQFGETGGAFSVNFGTAINVELPLSHADCPCTVNSPTGVYAGLSGNISVIQSSSGNDTIGTWGSNWKFAGGIAPTLSTGANDVDVLPFYCRTTTFCVVTFVGNVR